MRPASALAVPALAALALAGLAPPALAHETGVPHLDFAQGFAHPFGGFDHLLAMLAVGFWAAQSGGRAVWALPLAFPAAMAVGAWAAVQGIGADAAALGVEPVVAASVAALGLLLAFGVRLPLVFGVALVAAFGLAHGHAHGAEMGAGTTAWAYGAGFALATAALHGAGIGLSVAGRGRIADGAVRAAGSAVAATGLLMLLGGV